MKPRKFEQDPISMPRHKWLKRGATALMFSAILAPAAWMLANDDNGAALRQEKIEERARIEKIKALSQKFNLESLDMSISLAPFPRDYYITEGEATIRVGRCQEKFTIQQWQDSGGNFTGPYHLGDQNKDNPFAIMRNDHLIGFRDETPQNLAKAFPDDCTA